MNVECLTFYGISYMQLTLSKAAIHSECWATNILYPGKYPHLKAVFINCVLL